MTSNGKDDGPKLREEKNYREFYPSLADTQLLPLIFDIKNVKNLNLPEMDQSNNDLLSHTIQCKQTIFNGKINTEPLIIGNTVANFRKCKFNIAELAKDIDNAMVEKDLIYEQSKPRLKKKKVAVQSDLGAQINNAESLLSSSYMLKIRHDFNKQNQIFNMKDLIRDSPGLKNFKIQYDMDEQDFLFIKHLNEIYPDLNLNELQFEALISILEYQWSYMQSHFPIPAPPLASFDQLCSVCNTEETSTNNIIFCDSCNVAVHQDCYGILFIPPGPWLCRPCIQKNLTLTKPYCCVCPEIGGPLKQTSCGTWVHVWCAVWVRELCFGNWHYLEPVEGIEKIPASRWRLVCSICKMKRGACIQCTNKSCFTAFHVSCAMKAGYQMTQLETGSLAEMALGNEKLECFCDKHSDSIPDIENRIQEIRDEVWEINTFAILDDNVTGKNHSPLDDTISNIRKFPTAPMIFVHQLQSVLSQLMINNNGLRNISIDICKYWSLKRELNDGAPLFEPNNSHVYSFDLLDEGQINDRLEFGKILSPDLASLQELSKLVYKRSNSLIEKVTNDRLIHDIIQNPDLFVLNSIIIKKFVISDIFKQLKFSLVDPKYKDVLRMCEERKFKKATDFYKAINQMFDEILESPDTSRVLGKNIEKAQGILGVASGSLTNNNLKEMLEQDFSIYDSLNTKELEWNSFFALKTEGLSDVEELDDSDKSRLDDILSDKFVKPRTKIKIKPRRLRSRRRR
ncbi:similar to Saccharomyces cerevisiae YPR031W NTO1 Subunit of the NuA3 histone acetyltransferase complex that acetylates histone H3 [Maudiozyma saulgeensis]|uniref:Similar to Saccharomyces cerevisiae YPR031W NTO1 Subunit of the NuA3 histone acetyltransferase complex that acetylates histone H3 n=1 Tax=Maudiozyma saulgeensis TaxID=1789683 RepID=A0A1X7QXR9_9SACH|nr:similar to Saccharomyces cerevisiae YPR031W NTO1 Subunit of the NuA3 histone acetyltransferase complex that acetylates histone H3 [Kazachstania saulgeensis]